MRLIEFHETAGLDGSLHLTIPANRAGACYRVTVLVEDETAAQNEPVDENGWPVGFFEATAGSIQDETFVRPEGLPLKCH